MAAYMRHQFPFLGIPAPERRRLQAAAWRGLPKPSSGADVIATVDALWALPEREYQYAALDYLARNIQVCDASAIEAIERWITTKSWWDTVDALCRSGAGELVRQHPELRAVIDRWLNSDQLWLIRSAILHQERWGPGIDVKWMFMACQQRATHPDFFIRKAIGWVLRSYAHRGANEANEVRAFLREHDTSLSGLSKREALLRIHD
jgi:3-methyladenine DNA glycosylase AlkD